MDACTRTAKCTCADCAAFSGLTLKGIGNSGESRMDEEAPAPVQAPKRKVAQSGKAAPAAPVAAPAPPPPQVEVDVIAVVAPPTAVEAESETAPEQATGFQRSSSPPVRGAPATIAATSYGGFPSEEFGAPETAAAVPGTWLVSDCVVDPNRSACPFTCVFWFPATFPFIFSILCLKLWCL